MIDNSVNQVEKNNDKIWNDTRKYTKECIQGNVMIIQIITLYHDSWIISIFKRILKISK